jgi:2-keto-myo-inositol isomerase
VTGYVEPLGMQHSTMSRQEMACWAVTDVGGWDCFRLCYDTFQFFRCGDDHLFPERIGIVHVSGISRTDLAPHELTEPDRGLIFPDDRVKNVRRLREVVAAGYSGYVSIEPFDPQVQFDPDLASRLLASVDFLTALVAFAR